MIYWPSKTVAAARDLGMDWGPTLAKIARQEEVAQPTVVNSVWTRLSGSATFTSGAINPDGRRTVTRIAGGTANQQSVFRNTVTLSDGKVLTEDAFIKVRA